jgi:hypothetical protein
MSVLGISTGTILDVIASYFLEVGVIILVVLTIIIGIAVVRQIFNMVRSELSK